MSKVFNDLTAIIGYDATVSLCRELGGVTIVMAEGRTRSSAIQRERVAEIIGDDKYQTLLSHYIPGSRINIPIGRGAIAEARNQKIIEMIDAGVPEDTIALTCRCTTRHVQLVGKKGIDAAKAKLGEDLQASLF